MRAAVPAQIGHHIHPRSDVSGGEIDPYQGFEAQ